MATKTWNLVACKYSTAKINNNRISFRLNLKLNKSLRI